MKRAFLAFLGVALLLGAAAAPAVAAVPDDAAVRKILSDRIDVLHHGVGIVVGVIEPSGRRVISYGTFDAGDKRPVNGDTIFEIGSATKVFTSLLLADMVARGEVALTDPVSKYLPPEVKVPERNGKQITLADLATHTSGLPRMPANFTPKDPSNPYADYTAQQMYDFVSSYQLTRDIGSQYEYSNFAAGLLGNALARRAGMDYETLVRKRILDPLKMKSTSITLTGAMKQRFAPGHDEQLARTSNWDIPTLAGAGALRSTVNDLLELLAVALGYKKSTLAPAMSSMLARRLPTGRPGMEIALGWHIFNTPGRPEVVWHNGGTGGYRSFIGFDPKAKAGVVVLANTFTSSGVDDIGRYLLDPATPLQRVHKEIKVDPKLYDSYAGRYEIAPEFILTVTREGDRLFTQASGQPKFEVFPESERDFFVKAFDAQLTFQVDAEGRATAVVIHQGGGDRLAKRIEGPAPPPKEHKEISLDAAILDRYVGRYELVPGFIMTITREENQLYLQATGQPKFPLFAEGEQDFFLKVVDAQVHFDAVENGKATKLILHQGGVREAKRIE